MSPRNREAVPDGNDNTSVALSLRRNRRLRARTRASGARAMATSPRRRAGATAATHRARPSSRTGRPRPSVTVTRKRLLSGSTVRFVRLDNLLHQLMPHDVFFVEVNKGDALNPADNLHRFDQSGRAAGRQVDLRDVSGYHRL